jgi:hypothetical protein
MIGRLLNLAGLATLGAGLVGVLRQRSESQAIRRGRLERATAASEVAPVAHYGPLAARLAQWVPEPPTTSAGRLAAGAWAAPLTAVGIALALASGAEPRWDPEWRCYVTRGVRGPSAYALRAVGADANAIGQVVLSRRGDPQPILLAHEAVHVRQAERLGPMLFVLYVWFGARYGYRDHPLERAARLGARRALAAPAPAPGDC